MPVMAYVYNIQVLSMQQRCNIANTSMKLFYFRNLMWILSYVHSWFCFARQVSIHCIILLLNKFQCIRLSLPNPMNRLLKILTIKKLDIQSSCFQSSMGVSSMGVQQCCVSQCHRVIMGVQQCCVSRPLSSMGVQQCCCSSHQWACCCRFPQFAKDLIAKSRLSAIRESFHLGKIPAIQYCY